MNNIVYRFRLTKTLYDQARLTRQGVGAVLGSWEEGEYRLLCEYVRACRKLSPKYVQKLAEFMGQEPKDVVIDILHARDFNGEPEDSSKDFGGVYLPEDDTDRRAFIDKLCSGQEQSDMEI